MHNASPITRINYWGNCAEGVWWPCYIGSDICFQDDLKSIFTLFPEQLLKGLVSWGSPGKYSTIDCFLGDVLGVLSCPFWSTVLRCGARLPMHTLNYWTTLVCGASFLTGCVLECDQDIIDLWQYYVCCTRSGITRCTLFLVLFLCHMCWCGLHSALWLHIVYLCAASLQNQYRRSFIPLSVSLWNNLGDLIFVRWANAFLLP